MPFPLNYERPDDPAEVSWKLVCAGLALFVVLLVVFLAAPPTGSGLQACFSLTWFLAALFIGMSGVSHLRAPANKRRMLLKYVGVLEIILSVGLVIAYMPIHSEFQALRLRP